MASTSAMASSGLYRLCLRDLSEGMVVEPIPGWVYFLTPTWHTLVKAGGPAKTIAPRGVKNVRVHTGHYDNLSSQPLLYVGLRKVKKTKKELERGFSVKAPHKFYEFMTTTGEVVNMQSDDLQRFTPCDEHRDEFKVRS